MPRHCRPSDTKKIKSAMFIKILVLARQQSILHMIRYLVEFHDIALLGPTNTIKSLTISVF